MGQKGCGNGRVISLDVETTGLVAWKDEILSLSMCDAMTGEKLWHRLYKPDKARSWAGAQAVNHISPEMVEYCTSISDDADEINSMIMNAVALVIYNADFDLLFLEAANIIREENDFIYYDSMIDFAIEYGEWSDYYDDYKWQKLTTAANYIGYEWNGCAHDSLADARASAAVWRWLVGKDATHKDTWRYVGKGVYGA